MPESRPKRPQADGLSRACFDGDLASVQQYLAEGADLLAPRPAGRGGGTQCMDRQESVFLAIHDCSLFARVDCLRALVATGTTGLQGRVRRPGAHLGGPRLAISRHTDEQAVISVERRRLRSRAGDALWLI